MNKESILNVKFLHWMIRESFLSKTLYGLWHSCVYCFYKTRMVLHFISTIPRRLGLKDKRYMPLRELKGKYKGKRIFITCTGPSLTIEDLELLKNEYVFGMNSICLIHDKTDWKPDFFGIQDDNVFVRVKDSLLSTNNGLVFAPYSYKKKYGTPENWVYFDVTGYYNCYEMLYKHKYFAKFSGDSYSVNYGGYSITYTIMQLAVYMGFKEIYLLGADCTYMGEKQHFIEHGNYDPSAAEATDRLVAAYSAAKEYAERHGIKIVNVTRGGCLELFPRMQLEDVLAKNEKNKSC